jgi:hypothetical protein
VAAQKVPEGGDVLVDLPVGEIGAVAGEPGGLWEGGGGAGLVGIAEDELARLGVESRGR